MIEIIVVSYSNEAPARPLSAQFGHEGGSIGRSDDNHLILADPKHHVSRLQAIVVSEGDRHRITNLSHANPTILNGSELACDVAHPLQPGDEMQIGMYVLRAHAPSRLPAVARHAETATIAGCSTGHASQPPVATPAFDAPATGHSAPAAEMGYPLQAAARTTAASTDGTVTTDATRMPDVAAQMPPEAADNQALLQAFLKGAGIPSITLSSGLTPELMETVGALLATAIDGTVDLIGLRASVKREVNADVTMVVVRNNNPLKFLPDGATVLTQMLRKRMPGFMGPVDAMHDAFDDLHAHQLGVMAGMQASLRELHRQLDPAVIDGENLAATRMARIFPVRRKAALWDRYCSLHRQLAGTPQSAAQKLSGKAFLSAYGEASDEYRDEASNAR